MTSSLKILSLGALEYIRLHPEMYVPAGGMTLASKLAGLLAMDALALGAEDVRIVRKGEWYAVVADRDWLRLGRITSDIAELFTKTLALPEAGVNSVRHEVVVSAFSSDVLTAVDTEITVVHSGEDEKEVAIGVDLCQRFAPWRVVGFRCVETSLHEGATT